MVLFPRFIYDDNAGESGAGASDATIQNQSTDVVIPEDIQKELAELRAFKQAIAEKEPEKTPEQVAKEAEIEKANFRKYAIEKDLLKDDDFSKFDTVSKKAEHDLVFEKFSKKYQVTFGLG